MLEFLFFFLLLELNEKEVDFQLILGFGMLLVQIVFDKLATQEKVNNEKKVAFRSRGNSRQLQAQGSLGCRMRKDREIAEKEPFGE